MARRLLLRKSTPWLLGVELCATAGCFQTVDEAAALKSGGQKAAHQPDADAGSGAPFPIIVDTPAIALPDGTTTTDPCVANAAWSMDILKKDCASCHEAPNQVGLPPWDFVLEPAKLTTTVDTRTNLLFVAPGDPDRSRIYQRIANNEMPPPPNSSVAQALPRPSLSDISVIRQWIVCLGGPATGTGGAGGTTGAGGTGDPTGAGGAAGTTGVGGAAGTSGSGGANGTAGTSGTGGTSGAGGTTGAAGTAGAAGASGRGGTTATGGASGRGGTTGTGGASGRGGTTGTAGAGGRDNTRYNFETSVQGWQSGADSDVAAFTSVATSTAQHFAGASSLEGTIAATAATKYSLDVLNPAPAPGPGSAITFEVFIPTGALVDWVQPYVLDAGGVFTGYYVGNPAQGVWNTITVSVPAGAMVIDRMGVQLHTSGSWSGTVNVDSVNW